MNGFVFTEKMIRDATGDEKTKVKKKTVYNPRPKWVEKSANHFILIAWDIWFNLAPFLKKELRKRSPKKLLLESNGDPLFELRFEENKLKLIILQEWAAKRLKLPMEYVFKNSPNLLESYTEIILTLK